jgi:hypothetical protein
MPKTAKTSSKKTVKAAAKKLGKRYAPGRPRKIKICVDFSTYPDNTTLGPTYTQGGLTFTQLGPAPVMFANATLGQIGLQFPHAGLEIKLPAPTRAASLFFGTFGGPVTLETRNGATLVSTQTINTNNTYQNISVSPGSPFTRLTFRGGNNEGILVRICIVLVICD